MAKIHIFDYEDGIQDFIGQMLPYDYKSFDWDKDGFFKFDELNPGDYNLTIVYKEGSKLASTTKTVPKK